MQFQSTTTSFKNVEILSEKQKYFLNNFKMREEQKIQDCDY